VMLFLPQSGDEDLPQTIHRGATRRGLLRWYKVVLCLLLIVVVFFLYAQQISVLLLPGGYDSLSAIDHDSGMRVAFDEARTEIQGLQLRNEELRKQLKNALEISHTKTNSSSEGSSSSEEMLKFLADAGLPKPITPSEQERQKENLTTGTFRSHDSSLVASVRDFHGHRVYCMVPTIYAQHRFERIEGVLNTWAKRCDVVKLFIDPPEEGQTFPKYYPPRRIGNLRVEMVQVPLVRKNDPMSADKKYLKKSCGDPGHPEPCRHIWEKVWRSWVYIADHDLNKAEWFFKIDDDTYFFPEFLKLHFLFNKWDPEEGRYFGHVSYQAKKPFVNGAMVGLSRKALALVAPVYKTMPNEYGPRSKFEHNRCVDRDGASQETVEAICLNALGIKATTLEDRFGMQKVNVFRISDGMWLRKRKGTTSWYWFNKPHTSICCSEIPAAFHWYKKPKHLYKLEQILYGKNDTFLERNLYSRSLIDALKEDPKTKHEPVVFDKGTIPLYVFLREVEYLFRVRENIRALNHAIKSSGMYQSN